MSNVSIRVVMNKASFKINGVEGKPMPLEEALNRIKNNNYVLDNPEELPAFFKKQYENLKEAKA